MISLYRESFAVAGRFCFWTLVLLLTACSSVEQPCPAPDGKDVIYVISEDWHAEIGFPVAQLDNNLAFYRKVFPGAKVLLFGYGKRTFFTAPADTWSEYILGPVPGPAAIQVIGLNVAPTEAYPGRTLTLAMPPGGSAALSNFIWNDLAKDASGKPYVIAPSHDPDGLFYQAGSEYNLFHTCNTWTADALHAAGLPVSGDGVIFSGQVMARTSDAAENQCNNKGQ